MILGKTAEKAKEKEKEKRGTCNISIASEDFSFELTSNSIIYNYKQNVVPSKLINEFQIGYANFLCLSSVNTLEIE